MFSHNEKETRLLRNIDQLLDALEVTMEQDAEPGNRAIGYSVKDRAMAQLTAILKETSRLEQLCWSGDEQAGDGMDAGSLNRLPELRRLVRAKAEEIELMLQ